MFWLLNGPLTADLVREQIRQMADRGCGGFFLHPMGERFRVRDFISGMEPAYLSDDYFDLVRIAVEEAGRLGLYAWLYDEGGWPSGTAQGLVLEGHPELAARVLRAGGTGEVIAEVSLGEQVIAFTREIVEGAVDHLNEDATRRFIEVTHERYAEAVGDHFGGTIPGIFTDETSIRGIVGTDMIPWTASMLEEFRSQRGFDLQASLPALFSADALGVDPAEHLSEAEIAALRCEFTELWTDLFEAAYFEPINRWCEEHGLIHTGHVGGEDNLPDHRRGFGHFFKTAGTLHAPGVDAIWRQIYPGEDNFAFPGFAASALAQRAWQEPGESPWHNLALSETFAVYGHSLRPEQMRWVADYQFALGINYICPMALYSHTGGGHWVGTMSHLGEGNPLWESFSSFAEHCAVMSTAIRESEPIVDVAVYYPIEAAWLGGEGMEAAWQSLREICASLQARQVAFDFIDARTLAAGEVAGGCLASAGQLYGTVIVPQTPIMSADVLSALADLRASGGRVALCGERPRMAAEFGGGEAFSEALGRVLQDAVEMDRAYAQRNMGGDDPRGLGMSLTFPLDGFTTAYLGPGGSAQFTDREVADGACLLVPPEEIARLAELLLLVVGRYELQLDSPQPDLMVSSRAAGEVGVHLLHNQGERAIEPKLMLTADEPRVVELRDSLTGEVRLLAVHREVSETTTFSLKLLPGASALITTCPIEGDPPIAPRKMALMAISTEVRAQSLEIVREHVITAEGDLQVREAAYVPAEVPADFHLQPLEELGLREFAGTVRYIIDLYVPTGNEGRTLFLDLGEAGCVVRAWLNGEELGESAWPPHLVEITEIAVEGINDLVVEVTTTLANQVARPEVVEWARAKGWANAYYERTLPWMQQSLRSGLVGPVRVLRQYR